MPDVDRVLFGYKQVADVPECPCGDCGRYMMAERTVDPMQVKLIAWCGRWTVGTFESPEERAAWMEANGVQA